MADKQLYLFAGEHYMVMKALGELIASLDLPLPEINISGFKAMPEPDVLIEACAALPLMAERRLVYVSDYAAVTALGSAEETKKLAEYLPRLPETTVLALCCEGLPDKRRALYKRFAEAGAVREFPPPKPSECAAFAVEQAKKQGARMSGKTAAQLVALAGCDYYTIENEAAKLAVYVGAGNEITQEHVKECASRTLDYNIFELHSLLLRRDAAQAQQLLADVLDTERPEGLVGLIAKKFRDMYKVKSLLETGCGPGRIAETLKMKEYPVQMLTQECARFSRAQLKGALCALADLDFAVKSGEKDALIAMTQTLLTIYGF
jgi:DNA polymerase-3 subunit delta